MKFDVELFKSDFQKLKVKIRNFCGHVMYSNYKPDYAFNMLRFPWMLASILFLATSALYGIALCIHVYEKHEINENLRTHRVDVITCHSPIFLTRDEAATNNPTDSLDQIWISLYTSTSDGESILFLEKYTRRELRLVNTSCTIQYNVDERSIIEYGE